MPLAMLAGTPYGQGEKTLAAGDMLALYTDGITEAQNPAGIDFDMVGIRNAVAAHINKPLPIVGEEIHRSLDRHTRGAPLADDRTLVLVRRRA
jgi:sigma-B regulation protein RsbU (phosphoserine phosphatase)